MAKQPIPTSNRRKSTKTEKVVKGNNEFRVSGHIRKPDGTALPDLTVRAYDQDWKHFQPLGEVVTNEAGYYEVNFTREQAGQREKKNPDIQIRVFNRQGVELGASNTVFNAPKKAKIDLVVQIPSEYEAQLAILAERDRANFGVLLRDLNVPSTLMKKMKQAGIESFIDLRSRGMDFSGIPKISPELKEKLTAHARLATISSDLEINKKLINAGVESTVALAKMDAERLAGQAKIPQTTARDIVEQAKLARAERLGTLMDAKLAFDPANQGFKHYIPLDRPLLQLEEFVSPKPDKETCQACEECKSALSPAAYLVDLIDFMKDSFPQDFPDLGSLDKRFYRPFKNIALNCEAVEQKVRQVEIANEVLERFIITKRSGLTRQQLYAEFAAVSGYPKPAILSKMFEAYLSELGTTRKEVADAFKAAYPQAPDQPDRAQLDGLLEYLGLTEVDLKIGLTELDLQNLEQRNIALEDVDKIPPLIRKSKIAGLNQFDPNEIVAYHDAVARAETSIDRVKEYILPEIRANLIHAALKADPKFKSAKELGNYLHTDLSIDACAMTTRVANIIEALQSFILAFQLGRETESLPNAQLKLSRSDFDARWRWLQSYSLWHAAQMVFLYPENFLFPNVRRNQTPQFKSLLEAIKAENASSSSIRQGLLEYEQSVGFDMAGRYVNFAVSVENHVFLFSTGVNEVYWTEQSSDGDWRGWSKTDKLAGKRMVGAVAFNNRIYLFLRPDSPSTKKLEFAWMELDGSINALASSPDFSFEVPYLFSYSNSFVFIASADHLTVYFRNGNKFTGGCMDRFHRWWITIPEIGDGRFDSISAHMRAVGHLAGRDYFAIASSGILYLVEIDNPHQQFNFGSANIATINAWQVLAIGQELSNYANYACTMQGNKMVIVLFDGQQNNIAHFGKNMAPAWVKLETDIGGNAALVSLGDMLILHDSWRFFLFTFDGKTIVKVGKGTLLFDSQIRVAHPILESEIKLKDFRQRQAQLYSRSQPGDFVRLILDEWYFFIPLAIARALNDARHYQDAMHWLHVVFNPFQGSESERLIYREFINTDDVGTDFRNNIAWLNDPFNPFTIARIRVGVFLKHVIYQYVENLLDWADAEFTSDTSESINRARELYELAEDILQIKYLPQDVCGNAWRDLMAEILTLHSLEEGQALRLIIAPVQKLNGRVKPSDIDEIRKRLNAIGTFSQRFADVKQYVDQIMARAMPAKTLEQVKQGQKECQVNELLWEDKYNSVPGKGKIIGFADEYERNLTIMKGGARNNAGGIAEFAVVEALPLKIGCGFCVPINPLLNVLRFRIESNLEKIRTCRNYGGMRRSLQTYATPANPVSAVQRSAAGEEIDDAIPTEPPPVYRFSYLIERARYYVSVAQQLENFLLASVEKNEQEQYNLLKAKQDLKVSQMNLALQALRIKEASDGVELARRQKDRAQFQKGHFDGLIAARLSNYEQEALSDTLIAMRWSIASGIIGGAGAIAAMIAGGITGSAAGGPLSAALGTTLGGIVGALSNLGGAAQAAGAMASASSSHASFRSMQASFERRKQDWIYQQGLAGWDIKIGEQGIIIANDRLDITNKERDVAQLQADFASEVVNFLGEKFTNKDLYDWMARVLKRYYREHLNFATVIARMAQTALKFERQESIAIIAPYYSEREKKDLLAAENLLTDINKLDQHRLVTEKRRKELTKVISLASIAPVEFQQLRQEGWMTFAIPMEWFDRDFPGHYMRLIKNVSLTAVALIPPVEGIHATLSNSGLSRVMVPPFDQPRVIQRLPESIAVSAANNGTGLFELRLDDPILLPFEGSGVETTWTLEMPKGSNRFDYETLMDILFTVRYTAMEDLSYRDKVVKQLAKTVTGSSSFGLRTTFPDEWYDLHNPDFADQKEYGYDPGKIHPPYEMEFEIRKSDFPPNESVIEMLRLNLVLAQEQTLRKSSVKAPIEIEFIPDEPIGAMDLYAVQIEFDWDIANDKGGPISLTAFSHKNGQTSPIPILFSTLKPFGRWRLKIKTNGQDSAGRTIDSANYPELFKNSSSISIGNPNQTKLDLNWLKDILFVITYNANVEYKFAD